MSTAVITGSAGLIGSEATTFFTNLGLDIIGIENDMRRVFFGAEASTSWNHERLKGDLGSRYRHANFDIRDREKVERLFEDVGKDIRSNSP
jgi:CDP-paratose 2-epimerase